MERNSFSNNSVSILSGRLSHPVSSVTTTTTTTFLLRNFNFFLSNEIKAGQGMLPARQFPGLCQIIFHQGMFRSMNT